MNKKFSLRPSTKRFRFAAAVYQSLGTIDVFLSTPTVISKIFGKMEVVSGDIFTHLDLDVSDNHSSTAGTVDNFLVKKSAHISTKAKDIVGKECRVPLVSADGHVFAKILLADCFFFSIAQRKKMRWYFVHLSANKPYILLERARSEETTKVTFKTLKDLTQKCDAGQRIRQDQYDSVFSSLLKTFPSLKTFSI